jgi:hypothetical protein
MRNAVNLVRIEDAVKHDGSFLSAVIRIGFTFMVLAATDFPEINIR